MNTAANTSPELDEQLEALARSHLGIETLTTRNSDRLDFHDVVVWDLKAALAEAVALGRSLQKAEDAKDDTKWRPLALQFDGHRMQALAHLNCMVQDPERHKEQAQKFLSARPLSGEKVLEARIQAIAAAREVQPS